MRAEDPRVARRRRATTESLEHHDRWDPASRGESTDARTHVHAKVMASYDLALCDSVSLVVSISLQRLRGAWHEALAKA